VLYDAFYFDIARESNLIWKKDTYTHFGVSADICGVRGLFIRFSISRTFIYVQIFIGLKIENLSKLNAFILIAMEKK